MNIDLLKEDACLVATFGRRSGRLKSDALYTAIQKAEAAQPALSSSSSEIIALQSALATAVVELAPVTLFDLRNKKFNPFPHSTGDSSGKNGSSILKFSLLLWALLLMVTGGYYAAWQDRASDILVEFEKNKLDQKRELFNALIPIVIQANVKNDDVADATWRLENSELSQTIEKTRSISAEIIDDTKRMKAVYDRFFPSFLWAISHPHPGIGSAEQAPSVPADTTTLAGVGVDEKVSSISSFNSLIWKVLTFSNSLSGPGSRKCSIPPFGRLDDRWLYFEAEQQLKENVPKLYMQVINHDVLRLKVRCIIGLDLIEKETVQLDRETSDLGYEIKGLLKTVNVWLLPAVYGMLGATIFFLRRLINPLDPDPEFIRVPLRVFLGGFAGVAIAWFWRPDENGMVNFAEVSIGALTTAFLVGFGVEIFFTFLDRVVTGLNQLSGTIGVR